jgi:hypothetical protein
MDRALSRRAASSSVGGASIRADAELRSQPVPDHGGAGHLLGDDDSSKRRPKTGPLVLDSGPPGDAGLPQPLGARCATMDRADAGRVCRRPGCKRSVCKRGAPREARAIADENDPSIHERAEEILLAKINKIADKKLPAVGTALFLRALIEFFFVKNRGSRESWDEAQARNERIKADLAAK